MSVFAVPRATAPALQTTMGETARPVRIAGRHVIGASWVSYEPGGILQYEELLSATLVREHGRPRVHITQIWVDSIESRDGGRELWGIPKDLASFVRDERSGLRAAATDGGVRVAEATFTRGLRLPGRWPTPMSVVQILDGAVKRTKVGGDANLRLGRSRWRVNPAGPLGYLDGHRPLLTLTLADFRLRFALRDRASPVRDP